MIKFNNLGKERVIEVKHVTQEDLELDRRVTRIEAVIGHNKEKIDFVDRNTKFPHVWFIVGYITMVALFVGLFVWQVYLFQILGKENQRHFDEIKQLLVELQPDVADNGRLILENRRLIEGNSVRLDSMQFKLKETNELLDTTNKLLDRTDELLDRTDELLDRTDELLDRTDELLDGTDELLDRTDEHSDKFDDRLAVVESVLTINHQPSGYYQTGKF